MTIENIKEMIDRKTKKTDLWLVLTGSVYYRGEKVVCLCIIAEVNQLSLNHAKQQVSYDIEDKIKDIIREREEKLILNKENHADENYEDLLEMSTIMERIAKRSIRYYKKLFK